MKVYTIQLAPIGKSEVSAEPGGCCCFSLLDMSAISLFGCLVWRETLDRTRSDSEMHEEKDG
eukprot:2232043-Rhodomonas_salina.1